MFVFRRHNRKSTTIKQSDKEKRRSRTLRSAIVVLDCESRSKDKQKNLVFQRLGVKTSKRLAGLGRAQIETKGLHLLKIDVK